LKSVSIVAGHQAFGLVVAAAAGLPALPQAGLQVDTHQVLLVVRTRLCGGVDLEPIEGKDADVVASALIPIADEVDQRHPPLGRKHRHSRHVEQRHRHGAVGRRLQAVITDVLGRNETDLHLRVTGDVADVHDGGLGVHLPRLVGRRGKRTVLCLPEDRHPPRLVRGQSLAVDDEDVFQTVVIEVFDPVVLQVVGYAQLVDCECGLVVREGGRRHQPHDNK
jgi:hypothetical protein